MKALILCVTAACFLPSTCAAQAVKLERKYKAGEKVLVNAKQKITQKLSLGGQDNQTVIESQSIVSVETGMPNDNGEFERTHSVQKMTRTFTSGNQKLVFDSSKPNETTGAAFPGSDQILEAMKAAAKMRKVYRFDKSNKLLTVAVAGVDMKTLPVGLRDEVSPEKLKKTRLQELAILPKTPVSAGESWQQKSELTLGAGQLLKLVTKYTYKGTQQLAGVDYDYIESEVMEATLVAAAAPPGLPQLSESNVKPVKSTSKIWFDRKAGRVAASKDHLQVVGTITLSLGAQSVDGDIDFTIDTDMKAATGSKGDGAR